MFWGLCASTALAVDVSQQPEIQMAFPSGPGTHLVFHARSTDHPLRPMMEENFTIEILETWIGGVTFKYNVHQEVIGSESGIQTLSSIDTCSAIDPWWDPSETSFDNRCEFWIPSKVYRELRIQHKSYLSIDTIARRDSVVRWELQGKTQFVVNINGQPVRLDALWVRTSRDDDIFILADSKNPLILAIRSTFFAWELVSVTTKGN